MSQSCRPEAPESRVVLDDRQGCPERLVSGMETTTHSEAPPTLLLTLTEVATHLRCTRRSVERQVAHHALHVIRFGRSVRVERSELERFIARQRELADAG